jgi:hypothetical protein
MPADWRNILMKNLSRSFLACGLILTFLISACGALQETSPTPVGTILPESVPSSTPVFTSTVPPTATDISTTPLIPITGENVVSLQCQFCVDGETHAVLVFPDYAYFDVVSTSPVTCFTANVVNGQRILICRGAQQTSFNLNICSDNKNCLQFPIALQECPLISAGSPVVTSTPSTPVFLTAIGTFVPTDDTPNNSPSSTPAQASVTPPPAATTAPPPSTSTTEPEPTDEPEPTNEPPPTDPPPTAEETSEPEPDPTEPNED